MKSLRQGCLRFALVSMLVLVSACSGMSTVGYPIGAGKYRVQRTITDQSAFATTQQRSWLELCDQKEIPEPGIWTVHRYEFVNCAGDGDLHFTASSGYATGLGSSAMQTGAILGGAALLANGLKHSGSTTTNNNAQSGGGANVNQAQGQGQVQGQGQIQGQGQAQVGF